MPNPVAPIIVLVNPYQKELAYFKAALELGVGVWLFRKAATGERLPAGYIWWGAMGAFAASAYAFYKAQRLEQPQDQIIPVQQIQSWIPTEVMAAL